jgi:modification methylase
VPQSNQHPGKMLPALARQAIEAYSDPGDLVLDPMCGIGTTLVEAIHTGREAIGVELEPRWASLARENIRHARAQGATGKAHVTEGDARSLAAPLTADLVLTSPPYACAIAQSVSDPDRPMRDNGTLNYSADRSNLGHARGQAYLEAMSAVYQACAAVLRPGGFMVLVTKDMRQDGALRNLSGQTIDICENLGLRYWQRIIGLIAAVRDDELVMRPSFWQTIQTRRARAAGQRTHVVAHEDVLVFRKPDECKASGSLGRRPAELDAPPGRRPAR